MSSNNAGSKDQPVKGAKDNTGQAFESGEPKLTGRSHGQAIDEKGAAAGKDAIKDQEKNAPRHNDNTSGGSGKTSQATESGRQRATS